MSTSEYYPVPFENLPVVGDELVKFIRHLDTAVGINGLTKGIANTIQERHGLVSPIFSSSETVTALAQEPCIIAVDHRQRKNAEVLALIAALPLRTNISENIKDDTSVFTAEEWATLGPHLQKYILGLRVTGPSTGKPTETLLRYYGVKRKELKPTDDRFNSTQIITGINKVKNGERLIICPDGAHSEERWAGIGRIAQRVNSDTNIIFATTRSLSSNLDLIKLCWPMREVNPFTAKVFFSNPIKASDIKSLNYSSTQTDDYLYDQYKQWIQDNRI